MKIIVTTNAYLASHGHQPKGDGLWMFSLRDGGELIHTVQAYGTYKTALAEARKVARQKQADTIVVLP